MSGFPKENKVENFGIYNLKLVSKITSEIKS